MSVRFLLNGKLVNVDPSGPHVSLLSFLREAGLTGTKEGCGEGECGACAVGLGLDDNGLRAVNSCLLPLSACHGRAVVSVEGVASSDGSLHPVQSALVEQGGSQCGYCTPGFVMSMFCEYYRPGREQFQLEAISGNLCRCTGYRPIIDAARSLPPASEDGNKRRLLVLPAHTEPFATRPDSLAALWSTLASTPNATLIAGGTDLMVDANQRFVRFDALVSLESVAELRSFEASDGQLRIGGALTLSELAERPHGIALFDQLLPSFASRLIRNRATLAGNLATASPIGDAAPVLLALETTLSCATAHGTRSIALDRFFTGFRRNVLAPGEIITELQLPLPAPALQRFYKVSKRSLDDISTVAAAFALDLQGGKVQRLRMAFGGIAATPLRAHAVEQLAQGKAWDRSTLEQLLQALESLGTPLSDLRGSAHYRRVLIGRLLEKFWTETQAERVP